MYKLKSSDNEIFYVQEGVIEQSETIKNMIDDGVTIGEIPLQVSSYTLVKVLEWCKKHQHNKIETDDNHNRGKKEWNREENDIKDWENKFFDELKTDKDVLYDLIMAANYLNVPELLDRLCRLVADMIKGKNPEVIRQTFNIKNDFSPNEEKEIRAEHAWAFEQ